MSSTSWQWVKANPDAAARRIRELERENAALRSLLREAITDYVDPYDLPEIEDYVLRVKAALEAQPCQCTNGIIRTVGRDNDEVIEDCPDCSGSKESQP